MADIKTTPTSVSPAAFIGSIESAQRRKDCRELVALMREVTGHPPNVGTEHRRLRSVSLQVRQRARGGHAADRILPSQTESRALRGPRPEEGPAGEARHAQNRKVVPLSELPRL